MLINIRWVDLENMDTYVLGRGKVRGASMFVTLEARQGNREKGIGGKGSSSMSIDDEADDKKHLAVETVVQKRIAGADEIHLYKGGAYARMLKAFRAEDIPGPRYTTLDLASQPPTDFSQAPDLTYWTKHLELAEKFARYAQNRNASAHSTGILHMIVSKAIIESAVQFRETAHWQEFVFTKSIKGAIPGTSFSHSTLSSLCVTNADSELYIGHLAYLKRAEVLLGSMACESRDQVLRRYRNGEKYTTMQPFKLASGAKAMQVSFKGEKLHDRLDVEARLWLEEHVEPAALQKKGAE